MTPSSDIRNFAPHSWRSNIGLVPQDPVLFTGTIADNIAYDRPDATREEIEEAAAMANCEFIWELPDGFETKSLFVFFDRCFRSTDRL